MRTIAILSQKGGSGRTTLTLHLAVAALHDGQSVAIVDLDPQASAAGWKDSRPGDDPVVVPIPHTRLSQALKTAADAGAALTLIDTAPTARTDVDSSLMSKLPVVNAAAGLSSMINYSTGGTASDANGFFHPLGDHAQVSFVIDGQPINNQQRQSLLHPTSSQCDPEHGVDHGRARSPVRR